MDMKKIPKPRMEEFERRLRREREKYERQQVQSVDREHSLFSEPIRVNPSEVDDDITAKLGDYSQAKEYISLYTVGISNSGHRQMPPNAVLPGIMPTSASNGGGAGAGVNANAPASSSSSSSSSSSNSSQRLPQLQQPPHHYQQQQQQSRQTPYLKQTDNKPPYNGRGGYPGQPVKNDIRSSSGMAPPKGPPSLLMGSNSFSSSLLPPPSTTIMPNGRQSASEKSFLGPPVSSLTTHNGRFSQPMIPKNRQKPLENDSIKHILNIVNTEYRTPADPLTQISATPHTTITESYNLNGPNKHKYAWDAIQPPASPPPAITTQQSMTVKSTVPVSTSNAPTAALPHSLSRQKEPIKLEKVTPTLEKQNSTLENDLELSDSDDDRKKQNRSVLNSSESSQSDSSESGSEESSKGEHHIQQKQLLHAHQQSLQHATNSISSAALNTAAVKKKLGQTITAGSGTTISGLLSSSVLGSAGSSCSGPSSNSSSNKTPSPSDSNKWNLSRYFKNSAAQQTQNDASPSSVVNAMNVSMNVPTMLPGGAQIIPEPTPQQLAAAAAAAAASQPNTAIIKNEAIADDDDEDDDEDDDDDDDCDGTMATATSVASDTFRRPAAAGTFVTRKPQGLSVTSLSPMSKNPLVDDIKKESDPLFPSQCAQHVPILNPSDFVAIPASHIKHESSTPVSLAGGMTIVTPLHKRSPALIGQNDDKCHAPELRKKSDKYMRIEGLSGLSSETNSSEDDESVTVPMPGPGGTWQIPGVPAAITALPRSPAMQPKPPLLPNSLTVTPVDPLPASPKNFTQRAKKPRKKPPLKPACDSSDDEEAQYNLPTVSINPAVMVAGRKPNSVAVPSEVNIAAAAVNKGRRRGRPRKTPTQSGNISSTSSTTKGPTLTAKKDVAKKPTDRRRLSRQNSSSAASTQGNTPTKANKNAKNQPVQLPQQTNAPIATVVQNAVAFSEDSSSSSSSYSTSKSSSSSSDSEGVSGGSASSSENEQKRQYNSTSATTVSAVGQQNTAAGRRIVKQLNKRKSSLDEAALQTATNKSRTQLSKDKNDSSGSSSDDSSAEEDPSKNLAEDVPMATAAPLQAVQSGGSSSIRSQNQQSPFKNAASSRIRLSSSCSSSSSSTGEDHSDSDHEVKRREKKLRRDKPKSDKNKISTLTRIFNPKEGGAKKQGQVVIIDQSEEMLAKEQHQQQIQTQQQTQISPRGKASQENLTHVSSIPPSTSAACATLNASQSPRLTPGHIKSPRNLLPSQLIAHRTPDRCSSSSERKIQQRIKTPTRTPTRTPPVTRTPTPTQNLHLASPLTTASPARSVSSANIGNVNNNNSNISSLICKIDLTRLLRVSSEWHTNTYRLYNSSSNGNRTPSTNQTTGAGPPSSRTPLYDHEKILNADLQATQLRLKSTSGSTPRSTGSRTPTQPERDLSRTRENLLNDANRNRLEEVHSNGRLSSRSADGSTTPKDLPPPAHPPPHLTPNGYTHRGFSTTLAGNLSNSNGDGSPSSKPLTAGVKHEHIKFEPDLDPPTTATLTTTTTTTTTAAATTATYGAADMKFKTNATTVKQEHITKQDFKPNELTLSENQLNDSLVVLNDAKLRRKRSSSSSPYKEKKRKKEKDAWNGAKDKDKEKERHLIDGRTTSGEYVSMENNAQSQKEFMLDQQLPPTNHDRLLDKQNMHNLNSTSPPANLRNTTNIAVMNSKMSFSGGHCASILTQNEASATGGINSTIKHLPPPPTPQVIYRSYFERDNETLSDDVCKNSNFMQEAVMRKHAADREQETFKQVTLYLEAVVFFLLSGAALENHRGSEEAAWTMYKDTLALIKFISSKFKHLPGSSANKVAILSLRCQSLISLKLYKMKRVLCRNIITICNEFFKSGKGEIVNGNTSSSISPSNSVCSQGSGSNTPPGKIVPQDIHFALHQQNQFLCYIASSHELWEQADRLVRQGNHTDFFIALDHEKGPLTLHSSMYEVFVYVQAGLKKLKDAK